MMMMNNTLWMFNFILELHMVILDALEQWENEHMVPHWIDETRSACAINFRCQNINILTEKNKK